MENVDEKKGQTEVLIAEDEYFSYKYCELLLNSVNIKLVRAKTGIEAISIVEKVPSLRIVLMNIDMSQMGGLEAVGKVKAIRPDLTVIAFTCYPPSFFKDKALQAGFDDYLYKPVRKELFLQTIMNYL